MTSAFIAISILKQISMSEKQLTNFLFYLSQEALSNADIYSRKERLSKNELIEMIITDKPKSIKRFDKDEELTKEEVIGLLDNN